MRTIFYLISSALALYPALLLAQKIEHPSRIKVSEFNARIKAIDDFISPTNDIQNSIKEFRTELETFKSPKMVKKDQATLEELTQKVKKLQDNVTSSAYFIQTSLIKKELEQLEKPIRERELYQENEKLVKKLESDPTYSQRLNRFIESTKESKSNQAKAIYYTLNSVEKSIADNFDKAYSYTIRERYVQEPYEKEIVDLTKKIENSLSYPEESKNKIKQQELELQKNKVAFSNLKEELSLDQFEIKFETWQMGLFNCEKDAQYMRSVNFPELLMLKNGGQVLSVLKLDPKATPNYHIAYACKKKGQFGGCLDNEKKELCRLDPSCEEILQRMETSFDRNAFFTELQGRFPTELLKTQQENYGDKNQVNLLRLLADDKKLGYYGLDELLAMMNPIIELSKTIVAKTPEEYLKKIQIDIEKNKKKMLAQITKVAGPNPSANKIEDTKRAINYIFVSMSSELERILNNDTLQKRAFEDCNPPAAGREIFCEANEQWQEKVKVFDAVVETKNLTPDECPRGVFRSYPLTRGRDENSCSENVFEDVENTIKAIENEIK